MKISREWLQTYFETPLPAAQELADALTFHAFEIESIENDVLDVKVTPNRGHDCLSYWGIAKEVSAILQIPLSVSAIEAWTGRDEFSMSMPIEVTVSDKDLCKRYMAWGLTGIKVGPSSRKLVERLAAMGQQSINNVVDATNYVMFNTGQPLHAFDAGKLKTTASKGPSFAAAKDGPLYSIEVRRAKNGEKMVALDKKEYELKESMLVISDKNSGEAIGVAGVKGGMPAAVSEATTDIIIESANFDGPSVRRTAQALKLRTDASSRFEQGISPELAAYGIHAAAKLIRKLAGGDLAGFADIYPMPQEKHSVSVTLKKINTVLGTTLTPSDVEAVFKRLSFTYQSGGDLFTVEVPFERQDLTIAEDLIEEVGRIVGYDKVPSTPLSKPKKKPAPNANFATAEKKREELVKDGYSEVITSVFVEKGERAVANKVDGLPGQGARPFLRTTLVEGLKEAYERNVRNKELLGIDKVRLFEIGTVWKGGKEIMMLGSADEKGIKEAPLKAAKITAYAKLPASATERYQPFSRYPYISRDIALWVSKGTEPVEVLDVICKAAGDLVVRSAKFDEFKKGDKISYAFRLVFQSFDRTLMDADANERMESVYKAVKEKGWEVR